MRSYLPIAGVIAALACCLSGCRAEPSAAAPPSAPEVEALPEPPSAAEPVSDPGTPAAAEDAPTGAVSGAHPAVWRIEPASSSRLNYLTVLSCGRLYSAPSGEYPAGGLGGIVHHEFQDDGDDVATVEVTPNGTGFVCAVAGADPERCYVAELEATLMLADNASPSFVVLAEENAVFKLFVNGGLVLTCDPAQSSGGQTGLRESAVFELKRGANELRMRLVLPSGGPVTVRLLLRGRGESGPFMLRQAE